MKTPSMPLERVREGFQKRSWDSLLPDPSDPDSVRSEKRDRLIKLLEIKEVELASLRLARIDRAGAEGANAEVAETPPVQAGGVDRLADAEHMGLDTSHGRRKANTSSRGARERERRRGHLPSLGGGLLGGSTAKPERRTHPRAQAIANGDNTPIVRQRTGRDSLSRAILFRRAGGLDTPMTAANTPGDTTLGTMYTNGTPGVYIPSMRERMIDVTGTELAEDMAGNLVAGIFAASDPCSVADSHGNGGGQESTEHDANPNATMFESQIENHTDEQRPGDGSSEQLYRIPYGGGGARKLVSFLMRFPEYCMYGRASRSGKHFAVLLGSLIDKEPKEIVVLSVEDDIRVSLVVGVQRSRRYFPAAIPFNVNFFDLAETTKGDPVLLVSCAFDLTDVDTQEARDESDTKLHVLVRGKEAVAVESEQPIIFVDAFGDRNEVALTGAYADQGARVMRFDPLWQSFAWKKDYEFLLPVDHDEGVVTHISKLLVIDGAEGTGSIGDNGPLHGQRSLQPSIKAVLASDFTSDDIVYTFGQDKSYLDRIENAEVFMDGKSWRWFLVHRKAIAELGFAGGSVLGPTPGSGSDEHSAGKKPRVLTAIFASDSYVAAGDINGTVTAWDLRDKTHEHVACKRFSIAVFEQTKVTAIVHVRAKDQDALVVMGSSGVCLLISLSEIFK